MLAHLLVVELHRTQIVSHAIFFFFSSRRRHTRCYRDWSSDVCSSDLPPAPPARPAPLQATPRKPSRPQASRKWASSRSEERRVGKECRSRSTWTHYNIHISG